MSQPVVAERDYTWRFRQYLFLSFMMLGIVNALLVRFFQARGLDRDQIGAILALMGLTAAVVPPLWGMWSDSSRDRRTPIFVAVAGTACAFSAFLLCHSFVAFLLVGLLFSGIFRGIGPMGTGMVFAYAEARGRDYSRIRVFGTAGYVIALVLMYFPLRGRDIETIFPCFIVFAALAAAGLLVVPRTQGTGRRKLDWGALRLLARRDFLVYVVCTFVAQASFATHYAFFTLYLRDDLKVSDAAIGFFWAFGSVLEVLMLLHAGKLINWWGTKWVLALGMLGIVTRLAIYAAAPVVWVVFLVQGLHALSFGAVHSSTVTFVNYAAPTKWRSSAQTIFEGVTIGLSSAVGALVGGLVSQAFGYRALFACAAGTAALALVAFVILGRSASLTRREEEPVEEAVQEE
jgi:PPP family 3-phenylpropionic acid transporter